MASQSDQFRRLMILIAVATVDMIGGAMVFPLIPFYAMKLHASPTTIGMIIASFFVAQLVSAPTWGRVRTEPGRDFQAGGWPHRSHDDRNGADRALQVER